MEFILTVMLSALSMNPDLCDSYRLEDIVGVASLDSTIDFHSRDWPGVCSFPNLLLDLRMDILLAKFPSCGVSLSMGLELALYPVSLSTTVFDFS